jgi:hypothetical protein
MYRKIICYFLASLFLISSVLLPLGDFSLLRDIPDMYRNYTKITTAEELGAIDFIGDYLLHGKEIFGNNEHDKSANGSNTVQFQHQANPLNVVFLQLPTTLIIESESILTHPLFYQQFCTSDFRNELLRPPLA